jgi:hypothetical protein
MSSASTTSVPRGKTPDSKRTSSVDAHDHIRGDALIQTTSIYARAEGAITFTAVVDESNLQTNRQQ